MSEGPLLTAAFVALHAELDGARCYDADASEGPEHRLDFVRSSMEPRTSHGAFVRDGYFAQAFCAASVTRLLLDGEVTQRAVCEICARMSGTPSARQQAEVAA